ncbi:MAG: hypothetical protein IJS14_05315 [Lentisphaeria bacterium]|nr:hypothetical protein [Lentisphaeria bacterium]
MDREYRSLLSLLDDENEQSAALAMAELLRRDEKQLEPILRKLQETTNPRLRKRIHQLQSTILLRRRRRNLTARLFGEKRNLLDGLIQLHLLWFDNDSSEGLRRQWKKLADEAKKVRTDTPERLAGFMRKHDFQLAHRDDLEQDHFCLGTILDGAPAADFMLCAMGVLLAADSGLTLSIVTDGEMEFLLRDMTGRILDPGRDWEILRCDDPDSAFVHWSVPMLLRYAASLMFTAAVSSDSFRYVYSIGSCLAGTSGGLSLPYPYGGSK